MVSGINSFGKIRSYRDRDAVKSHGGHRRLLLVLLLMLVVTLQTSVDGPGAYSAQDQAHLFSPAGSPAPAESSSPTVLATPAAALAAAASLPKAGDVITYLGEIVSWYRGRDNEAGQAREPAEVLIAADDHRIATEIVSLAFEAARAAAAVTQDSTAAEANSAIAAAGSHALPKTPAGHTASQDLTAKASEIQAQMDKDKASVAQLERRLRNASRQDRPLLQQSLANAQAQLQLDQSRFDAVTEIEDFESGEHVTQPGSPDTLIGQINELQNSVAPAQEQQPSQTVPANNSGSGNTEPAGLLSNVRLLIRLAGEDGVLQQAINQTAALHTATEKFHAPMAEAAIAIYDQALSLAKQAATGDYAAVRKKSAEFQELAALHKALGAVLLPLAKQNVLLNLYISNLERWRGLVGARIKDELRALAWNLAAFALLFVIVASGAIIWRRLTFRYVQDFQRRHTLMQLRRVAVSIVIALIIIFGFASELGTLGTILGFAAAGIALALQNVILSLAGYFYISGRFGIRISDRIQLSGISGDVLEIGLFKLTLMELSNDDFGLQPTGRIVVFPNSVVFQPNGNFFRQLPGSSFMWNELRLTLTPDCDYRLAEKKIVEVVNEVFVRYRDSVQRETRRVELELSVRFDMPKPQSRIELRSTGLAIVIRYPVPLHSAVQTADEIARRLVDAIRREPSLELAAQGTESLRPRPLAPHTSSAPPSTPTGADAAKP